MISFRDSELLNGATAGGVTKYVSHTNSSLQVRVMSTGEIFEFSGDIPYSERDDYGIGLYRATAPGDLAFYRVIMQCTKSARNTAAIFDC